MRYWLIIIATLISVQVFGQRIVKSGDMLYYDSIPYEVPNVYYRSEIGTDTNTSTIWYYHKHIPADTAQWVELTNGVHFVSNLSDTSGFVTYNNITQALDTVYYPTFNAPALDSFQFLTDTLLGSFLYVALRNPDSSANSFFSVQAIQPLEWEAIGGGGGFYKLKVNLDSLVDSLYNIAPDTFSNSFTFSGGDFIIGRNYAGDLTLDAGTINFEEFSNTDIILTDGDILFELYGDDTEYAFSVLNQDSIGIHGGLFMETDAYADVGVIGVNINADTASMFPAIRATIPSSSDDQTLSIDSTGRVFDISIEDGNTITFEDLYFDSTYIYNALDDTASAIRADIPSAWEQEIIPQFGSTITTNELDDNYLITSDYGIRAEGSGNDLLLDLDTINVRSWVESIADNYIGSDDQTLSTNGSAGNISIEDGNTININVDDADSDPTNEIDEFFGINELDTRIRLGLNASPEFDIYAGNKIIFYSPSDPSDEVYITTTAPDSAFIHGVIIDTAEAIRNDFPINTDAQEFSYSTGLGGVTATLSGATAGNNVISLSGSGGITVSQPVTDGYWRIDGSSINTDDQTLSIDSTGRVFDISIEDGNTITFEDQVDDADADNTNELQEFEHTYIDPNRIVLNLSDLGGTFQLDRSDFIEFNELGTGNYQLIVDTATMFPEIRATINDVDFWAQTGNDIYNTNPDNVSVGTSTNINRKLTVQQSGTDGLRIQNSTGATANYIEILQANSFGASVNMNVNTGAAALKLNAQSSGVGQISTIDLFPETSTTAATQLNIYNGDGTASINTRLSGKTTNSYINKNSGSLCIGCTTPTVKLDVGGQIRARTINSGAALTDIVVHDGNGILKSRTLASLGIPAAWELTLTPDNGSPIVLNDGNDQTDVTTEYGIFTENVGGDLVLSIDTTTVFPDIRSTIPDDNDWVINGAGIYNYDNRDVGINIQSPEHLLHIKSNNFGDRPFVIDQSNIGYPLAVIEEGGAGNANLFLYNNDSLINIRLATSGDSYFLNDSVGIGTDNPTAKLHVDGYVRIDKADEKSTADSVLILDNNNRIGFRSAADLGSDDQDLIWNFGSLPTVAILNIEDGLPVLFRESDFINLVNFGGTGNRLQHVLDTSALFTKIRDSVDNYLDNAAYNPTLGAIVYFDRFGNRMDTLELDDIGTGDFTDDGTYLTPFDWINNNHYDIDQDGSIIQLKPTDNFITLGDTLRSDTVINGIGIDEELLFEEFKNIIGGNQGQLYSGGNGITIDLAEVTLGVFDPDTMYDNATFDFGDMFNGTMGDTTHNVIRLQETRDDGNSKRGASLVWTEKDQAVELHNFGDYYGLLINSQFNENAPSNGSYSKIWGFGSIDIRAKSGWLGNESRINLVPNLGSISISADSVSIGDVAKIEELKVKGAGSNYYQFPITSPSNGEIIASDGTDQLVWVDPSSLTTPLWVYAGGFLGPETSVNSGMTNLYASNYSWNVDQTLGAGQDGYVMTFNNSTYELELQPPSGSSALWETDGTIINPIDDEIVNTDNNLGYQIQGENAISFGEFGFNYRAIAIGEQARLSDSVNYFMGYNAGSMGNTQTSIGIGENAMNNTDGIDIVSIGHGSGQGQTAEDIVNVGSFAGQNQSGEDNINIGSFAGYQTNGDYQINLGSNSATAAPPITRNNTFVAGYLTEAEQDSQIIFADYFTEAKFNNYTFDIDQSVGAGQDDYVLTYDDASGQIRLETGGGGGGGSDTSLWESDGSIIQPKNDEIVNTDNDGGYTIFDVNAINLGADQNGVAIGRDADVTGNGVSVGRLTNQGTQHTGDVVVGYGAATGATGNNKTFFGQLAGSNAAGNNNVGIGYASLQLVSGANNTALGYSTGANADGNNNVYLGYQSGGNNNNDYNIFIGSANDVGGAYDYSCIIGSDDVTYDAEITASNQFKLGTMFDHAVLNEWELDIDQTLGAGQDNYIMTYDNSDGQLSLEDITTLITEGQWLDDGTGNIYRSSGKVTIGGGAADEDAKLTIFSDGLNTDPFKIKSSVDDDLILRVQEGGAGHSNMFFYDKDENTTVQLTGSGSSTSYLMCSAFGIGINSPTASLHVESGGSGEDAFIIENGNNANELFRIQQGGTGNANMFFNANDGTTNVQFTSSGSGNSFVNVGGFGINETSPATTLHVGDGDVYVEEAGAALILTSPNGNCWEVTVDNSGNLNTSSVTCP